MHGLRAAIVALLIVLPSRGWAQDAGANAQKKENVWQALQNAGFGLHKGLSGGDASQGASFSYNHTSSTRETVYSADFALSYERPIDPAPAFGNLSILGDIDGSLATRSQRVNNALNFRLDGVAQVSRGNLGSADSDYLRFGPFYEASQDFKIQNAMGEVEYSPTRAALAMGVASLTDGVDFRWRPYLTVQAGRDIRGIGLSPELDHTRLRIVPEIALAVGLPGLSRALDIKSVELILDDTDYFLPLEHHRTQILAGNAVTGAKQNNNHLTASLGFTLDPGGVVSVGPNYTVGAQPPKFVYDHVLELTIKIGFGSSGLGLNH